MNKILIYNSGGGIGDSIQLFPLITSLKNHFNKSKFYYLGAHSNHFLGKLKEYNISLETIASSAPNMPISGILLSAGQRDPSCLLTSSTRIGLS